MFDNFGEYLFSLLIGPLKRAQKAKNQFFIYFKVIGKQFDQMKQDIFRVREESNILSASDAMLSVHGEDRDMVRLKGETVENYRTRLALKAIVSSEAGTNEGIRHLAHAFGYEQVEITKVDDAAKWAEATVRFIGGKIALDDQALLLSELDKIKPARTVLTLSKEQRYQAIIYSGACMVIGKSVTLRQV